MTEIAPQPRVLVFGAGAVGLLLGGILSGAGYDVTLLGRNQTIEPIERNGLSVRLPGRQFRTHPQAVSSINSETNTAPFDLVVLAVRAFAVERALESLSGLIADGGVLLSVQNGIGTERILSQALPEMDHIAASLTLSADAAEPGSASSSSRSGGIALAPVSQGAPVQAVADMFRSGGIPVDVLDGYRSMKWSKLLLNQMANGIPAILDWSPEQVYRNPDAFRVEQALLRETIRIIEAEGAQLVSLPGFPVPLLKWVLRLPPGIARRLLLRRVVGGRGEKLPSLLIDLRSGRTETEARWLYGAVAEIADSLDVPAPVNRRIHRMLAALAVNPDLHQSMRNQPAQLNQNVGLAKGEHPE